MTQQERLDDFIKRGLIRLHSVDFDCTMCGRNFDFEKLGRKLDSASFVLAHAKSCAVVKAI